MHGVSTGSAAGEAVGKGGAVVVAGGGVFYGFQNGDVNVFVAAVAVGNILAYQRHVDSLFRRFKVVYECFPGI